MPLKRSFTFEEAQTSEVVSAYLPHLHVIWSSVRRIRDAMCIFKALSCSYLITQNSGCRSALGNHARCNVAEPRKSSCCPATRKSTIQTHAKQSKDASMHLWRGSPMILSKIDWTHCDAVSREKASSAVETTDNRKRCTSDRHSTGEQISPASSAPSMALKCSITARRPTADTK